MGFVTNAPAMTTDAYDDGDATLQVAAGLRVADALRAAGRNTGLVVRLLPTVYPRTWENNKTVQIVQGDRVLRAFTSETVMNAHPAVLAHLISEKR